MGTSEHEGRTAFVRTYRTNATRLGTLLLAVAWHKLSHAVAAEGIVLTAEQAAAWASRGYLPDEAEPSVRAGITAELDAEMEQHVERQAGGSEAYLRQRLAEMAEQGTLVLPDEDE